jgi:HKD family nuclease
MAAKIQIMSNTNSPLVDVIKYELMGSTHIKIAVAFLRKSGLEQIQESLDYALTVNNAVVEVIVGLDFKTTDFNALMALKNIEDTNSNFVFYCFGDRSENYNELVFHPKIYLFDKAADSGTKYTSIVGSSNLTGGGLSSNFEVNSVFKEEKPTYYSQLLAIYNEIKYTDSIFNPSKKYIQRYGNIKKEIEKTGNMMDDDIQHEIKSLHDEEQTLPNPGLSLKKVIIDFMKQNEKNHTNAFSLNDIYNSVIPMTEERHMNMKMDTVKNSIRGELNKHEINSNHKDGSKLFKRTGRGLYELTDKGRGFDGR